MNFQSDDAKEKYVASITCSICLEMYNSDKKPVSIGCGHSLCRDCVQSLVASRTEITCPFDRKTFSINMDNIPFNYDLLQLATLYNEQQNQSTSNKRTEVCRVVKPSASQSSAPIAPSNSRPVLTIQPSSPAVRPSAPPQSQVVSQITEKRIHLVRSSENVEYGFELRKIETNNWFMIGNIKPNSIAYSFGLRDDDHIIELNGKPITNESSEKDLTKILKQSKKELNVVVSRNHGFKFNEERTGADKDLVYRVMEIKPGQVGFGFAVDNLDGKFVITQIDSKSAAKTAGMKLGDEIYEVNGVDVTKASTNDLAEIIKSNPKLLVLGVKTRKTKK